MDCKSCCPPGTTSCDSCCKCGPGWTCVIRKLEAEVDSKPFYNCSSPSCVCITDEKQKGEVASKELQGTEVEGACCECGEGYACITTITVGPNAGKVLFECGNGCKCELPTPGSVGGVVLK